jgi:flagellum-specific ATP synthase
MSLANVRAKIRSKPLSPTFGVITKINQTTITATGLKVSIGDTVRLVSKRKQVRFVRDDH